MVVSGPISVGYGHLVFQGVLQDYFFHGFILSQPTRLETVCAHKPHPIAWV